MIEIRRILCPVDFPETSRNALWCKPSTNVAYGKPYREILEVAEREGADLIVIGVRGRNPLDPGAVRVNHESCRPARVVSRADAEGVTAQKGERP
jgi:hypothetical protein